MFASVYHLRMHPEDAGRGIEAEVAVGFAVGERIVRGCTACIPALWALPASCVASVCLVQTNIRNASKCGQVAWFALLLLHGGL
jgi:hypothetical protein